MPPDYSEYCRTCGHKRNDIGICCNDDCAENPFFEDIQLKKPQLHLIQGGKR